MEQPFQVGQKVVCLGTSKVCGLEKGHIYTILKIKRFCKCAWAVDVGVTTIVGEIVCKDCGYSETVVALVRWLHYKLFAPIEENTNEIKNEFKEVTYTKIKKEVGVPQSVN